MLKHYRIYFERKRNRKNMATKITPPKVLIVVAVATNCIFKEKPEKQ